MASKKSFLESFGNYPKEYNRAIHGSYYPWVNYGPKDTPFYDVKLGDLKSWVQRRNKAPYASVATLSRYAWYYSMKWIDTRNGSPLKPLFHLLIVGSAINLVGCYSLVKTERWHKYHW